MARRGARNAPSAADVLRKMREQLEKGWPTGLTVLSGDDAFHLQKAQAALLGALAPEDASDFGMTVFADETVSVGTVVGAARSQGMFSSKRVVFVRELEILDGEPDPIVAYAKDPPPESYLIVRAPDLDQRRKLHKALATAGSLLVFAQPSGPGAGQEGSLRSLAEERGMKLDRRAGMLLDDLCGGDLYRASSELDKIRAWFGEEAGATITPEVIEQVAAGSGSMTGWEVADAILVRDGARAVAAARRLTDRGENAIAILGGLAWRIRTMLQAKAMMENGASSRQVVQAARAWAIQDRLIAGLRRYSLEELMAFPGLLLDADRTLKSRSIEPGAVLEQLVSRMTGRSGGVRHA